MIAIELTNTSLFLFTKFNRKWFSPNNHKDTHVLLELILSIVSTKHKNLHLNNVKQMADGTCGQLIPIRN